MHQPSREYRSDGILSKTAAQPELIAVWDVEQIEEIPEMTTQEQAMA